LAASFGQADRNSRVVRAVQFHKARGREQGDLIVGYMSARVGKPRIELRDRLLLVGAQNAEHKPMRLCKPMLIELAPQAQELLVLMHAATSVFAVPLAMRIHEGLVWSNRDQRTLLDKMLALLGIVDIGQASYLVADAYYASGKIIGGLLDQDNHWVTRARSNAVAYTRYVQTGPKRRGRPRVYAKKIALKSLFTDKSALQHTSSPVYGERNVTLQYRVCDLLWRPARRIVRFVAVVHPSRGRCLLMCTDTSLSAIEIIRLYGLRFKIEHSFKQAVRLVGSLSYHFWMKNMKPLRRRNGNQYLHRESLEYRNAVKRKISAYHLFIQAGIVSQGLLQYLSALFPQLVWQSFGSCKPFTKYPSLIVRSQSSALPVASLARSKCSHP
jgi:hypothetical protein